MLKKCQIWVEMEPSAQASFHKLNVDNSCEKKYSKLYITFLKPCPILLYSFTLWQIFSLGWWVIYIITTTTAFIYFGTVRIKWMFIIVNIYYFCSYFTFLIIQELWCIATKKCHCYQKNFLNKSKHFCAILLFFIKYWECLIYHELQ